MTKTEPPSQGVENSAAQLSGGRTPAPNSGPPKGTAILFSVGVVFAGLVYGLIQHMPTPVTPTPTGQESPAPSFGLADYESLRPGMTLVEARSILGKGIETSSSETEVNFVWLNSDGSSITAAFSDGKLRRKEQNGLK